MINMTCARSRLCALTNSRLLHADIFLTTLRHPVDHYFFYPKPPVDSTV